MATFLEVFSPDIAGNRSIARITILVAY